MKAISHGSTRKATEEGGAINRRDLLRLAAAAPLAAIGVPMPSAGAKGGECDCCAAVVPQTITLTIKQWTGTFPVPCELLDDMPFDLNAIVAAALALKTHAAQVGQ